MQEDKEPVFDAAETLGLALSALAGMVRDMTVDADAMRHATEAGFPTATDLADWLVRDADVPFREAHRIAGAVVRLAESKGVGLAGLSPDELQSVDNRLTEGVYGVLSVESSVASRTSFGGTAPNNVRAAVAVARQRFLD
jgi:argininosuccinate lyase